DAMFGLWVDRSSRNADHRTVMDADLAHDIMLEAYIESLDGVESPHDIVRGLHGMAQRTQHHASETHDAHLGSCTPHVAGGQNGDSGRVERDHSEAATIGDNLGNCAAQRMTANINIGIAPEGTGIVVAI